MSKMEILSSILIILLLNLPHQSTSQVCNNRVPDNSRYLVNPTTYKGVVVVRNPPCQLSPGLGFSCLFSHILGDDEQLSTQPNLNNGDSNNDIGKFIVWRSDTTTPYILFTLPSRTTTVRAMNIEFLNYPGQNFSLPNLQLYQVTNFIVDPNNPDAMPIDFDLVNNNNLSQHDHKVTSISLIFSRTSDFFLLYLNFTDAYNLDFFMVSEIDLCHDTQLAILRAQIVFQNPQLDNTVIIPSIDDFATKDTLVINCTVSVSGLFEWQWKQNGTLISNNAKFHIFTADGSRTSKLQLTGMNVNDAASYSCGVRHKQDSGDMFALRYQNLSFPVILDVLSDVTGYLEEGQVVLTCEVHGFLRSTNPVTWLVSDGSALTTSTSKYTITSSVASQPAVLISNRTIAQGMRSTLTIRQLSTEDKGTYTCCVDGTCTSLSLTVVPGTSPPPPTTPPLTTSPNGFNSTQPNTGSGNAGVIAAVIIVVLIIIIIAIILVVVLILFLRSKDIHWSFPKKFSLPTRRLSMEPLRRLSVRRRNTREPSTEISYESGEEMSVKKRLTKADIEWQLPHVDTSSSNSNGGLAEAAIIYSAVNKQEEAEKAPPIPPQNFDPQEEMCNGGGGFNTTIQNHYENDKFHDHSRDESPQRRMTNTSSPKLAKVNPGKLNSLDSNPIYEVTKTEQAVTMSEESNGTFEAPIYAQPNFPDKVNSPSPPTSAVNEPIYSEAIHPDLFSQGPELVMDSSLTPYAPIYADPHTLEKAVPPIKVPAFKIKELRPLGVGQFGEVMLAETVGLSRRDLKLSKTDNSRSIRMKVAVKKLRPQAQDQVRENFEKEIKFMSKLKDDNIVRLLAISKDDPPFIVMEYMENGDLHEFLQDFEPSISDTMLEANQLPISILLYMAVQIASGMRYLASLRYVHRDLATRNCLVGQNFVVKISDFGMSRSLYESSYYRVKGRAMLPIRWMASESFYGRFSEKTDVWSYGVTMWEIFTLAKHQPYEDIDDQDLIQDAIRGLSRQLLDKPECCPMNVYEVMLRCWEYAPNERADFEEIFNTLASVHQSL